MEKPPTKSKFLFLCGNFGKTWHFSGVFRTVVGMYMISHHLALMSVSVDFCMGIYGMNAKKNLTEKLSFQMTLI